MSSKLNNNTPRRIYNIKIDEEDDRDIMFKSEKLKVDNIILPDTFSLRNLMPPILNQGTLGSCGPVQISNNLRYCLRKLQFKEFQPSRLYLYYFTRLAEGSNLNEDTGISVRGGLKAIQKYGACSENNWGYDITKFTQRPDDNCVLAGKTHIPGFRYIRVQQSLVNIKQAISGGFPIIVGIKLYTSFENNSVTQTGIVSIPNVKKEACLGGHAVSLIAYDDKTQQFTASNSWGESWADKGYFTIPYEYILDTSLSSDFWIITYFK